MASFRFGDFLLEREKKQSPAAAAAVDPVQDDFSSDEMPGAADLPAGEKEPESIEITGDTDRESSGPGDIESLLKELEMSSQDDAEDYEVPDAETEGDEALKAYLEKEAERQEIAVSDDLGDEDGAAAEPSPASLSEADAFFSMIQEPERPASAAGNPSESDGHQSPSANTLVSLDDGEFLRLCERIKREFFTDWENRENSRSTLELQKRAIIGYEKEKTFFKNRITEILKHFGAQDTAYPMWYGSIEDAIYNEVWGLAGLAEWFTPKFAQSSSAKIIGERIYFLYQGHMQLMPQRISPDRRDQLIKAFLLLTPEERMDKSYHETYLLDGTRVTIFTEPMAKKGQASIIFRRYLIPDLSFEEQARRGTIPREAIPFFESMVAVGYNTVFLGAVRTGKTSFLSTWQHYEDPSLEGVMVETDPEIPMHTLLPGAPIIQLIADGEDLKRISKNLLRSDADYFILAEARDGIALDTAVRIAAKGTKRMKLTFHSRNPEQFPLEAATEIIKSTSGDLHLTMNMVASGFDFLFHFIQLQDKREKRLKAVYQMSLEDGEIRVRKICGLDLQSGRWSFSNSLAKDKVEYGMESDPQAFRRMQEELRKLERMNPPGGSQ